MDPELGESSGQGPGVSARTTPFAGDTAKKYAPIVRPSLRLTRQATPHPMHLRGCNEANVHLHMRVRQDCVRPGQANLVSVRR
jgi:hypothetical protein